VDEKLKKSIPQKANNGIILQFEGGLRRSSMLKYEKVEKFWEYIKQIAKKMDINLREQHRWSSADICFVEGEKFLIDGLGPVGKKPSTKTEYILRHSMLERSALLAVILSKIKNLKEQ
jgi:D-alanine-D-alanine ligase